MTLDRTKVWTGDLNVKALEPQPRVTVTLGIHGRAPKPLFEEQLQLFAPRRKVRRVDRPDLRVGRDALIERIDDAADALVAANEVEE